MINFYIVRHGQTIFNQKDMVQGWCDSPLTQTGINQAIGAGIGLNDVSFTHAYTSISERAYDTACAIIQDQEIPLTIDKRLKEFGFGMLEGEKNEVLMKPFHGDFATAIKVGWVKEGGENEKMVRERIRSFFDEVTQHHQDGNILITSHGLTITAMLKEMVPQDFNLKLLEHGIDNCSVTIIEYDGEYRLKVLNDTTYRDRGLTSMQSKG
ncbi:histidine phosphatase family protein [Beduini massiliensis]|uniref:histidine phosphatase family protein n=1 Tax=Beduini massiliensis TaxID=1585974 RepID=UPI000694FA44|nr:histidine phosphatase family protein [Beduini massiliensis]